MSLKSVVKNSIKQILSVVNKSYLLEYWQIKRNEHHVLPPIINLYSGFVYSGMKIIDVGANVGTYSKAFIQLGANVVGMEPQKYCQDILKKRFKDVLNFKLIPAASGANIASGEINKSHSHTIASMNSNWIKTVQASKRFNGEAWDKKETIQITTLDNVISNYFLPDYIKIDVEGFELEVLKGLSRPVNYISFEITLPEMEKAAIDCVTQVDSIGKYVYAIPDTKLADIKNWYSSTEIIAQLKTLSLGEEKISADIICKKSQL